MSNTHSPYSWHQSHDQATILLVVPYETQEEDVVVVFGKNHLLAGVRGQQPIVKGRLYGNVDSVSSAWQLETRSSRLSARERTTSTISTASTQSSFAFISDPEMSSSFAASSGQVSDTDDSLLAQSPAVSSPRSTPSNEHASPALLQRRSRTISSRAVSPGHPPCSMASSFSSVDSLHSPHSGRLLTLHLEKDQSIIWPSLIIGPVDILVSPSVPYPFVCDPILEHNYNMDPTSLVLIALELFDIRKDKEGAFEYLVRAWHQARVPTATVRLATYYLPSHTAYDDLVESSDIVPSGTTAYYLQRLCGPAGLAQLYLEAGMLHLEGAAKPLLSSSYSTLSSIRMADSHPVTHLGGTGGSQAWKLDREAASQYFDRARALQPGLDVPVLPLESAREQELEMPTMEIHPSAPASSVYSGDSIPDTELRRRRKKEEMTTTLDARTRAGADVDDSWYLYIPGIVGAGTALVVGVCVVGLLSFSTWRRNQGS